MSAIQTNTDFDRLSWHDNALYGIRLEPADPDAGDWRSDLVLSIDHIVEWLRVPAGRLRFSVAPALLTFHDTSSLSVGVDWRSEMLHDMAIDRIGREALAHPSGHTGLAWYRWHIALNWPAGGSLRFEASGFTQRLLTDPIEQDEQTLAPALRRSLLAPGAP